MAIFKVVLSCFECVYGIYRASIDIFLKFLRMRDILSLRAYCVTHHSFAYVSRRMRDAWQLC